MTDLKDFLSRWSRRKRGAIGEAPPQAPPVRSPHPVAERATPLPQGGREQAESADGASAQLPPSTELAFDLTQLPSIESITAKSEMSALSLPPGVPAELTRAALRRAWAVDPKYTGLCRARGECVGPQSPGSDPGFGALEMTDELRRHIAQLVNRDLREPSQPSTLQIPRLQETGRYRAPADVLAGLRQAVRSRPRAPTPAGGRAGAITAPAKLDGGTYANGGEPDQQRV